MSALALLLSDKGYQVLGSDYDKHFFTEEKLLDRKIPIFPFSVDNIRDDYFYIIGNAFENNVETEEIKKRGYPYKYYYDFIGEMNYQKVIAISGTHGKTTTTALIANILKQKYPVDYIIGDGSGGSSNAKYLVVEACEYRDHFLSFKPDILLINNIEFDHPDYFIDEKDVFESFQRLASQSGIVLTNGDCPLSKKISGMNVFTFGFDEENDYSIRKKNNNTYELSFKQEKELVSIPFFGDYMTYNTLAATIIGIWNNVSKEEIFLGIDSFIMPRRRGTEIKVGSNIIVDDYAHHPTEIRETLKGLRNKYPNYKMVLIFQPHTYSRTIAFLDEFAKSLKLANDVYIADIFTSVREKDEKDVDILIQKVGNAKKFNDPNQLKDYRNSLIITMGAGDINQNITTFINIFKN